MFMTWLGRCVGVVAAAGAVVAAPAAAHAGGHPRCPLVAHRGYHSSATENGMRALRSAVDRRADYLEVDVRTTRDDRLVLMHDATVARTTNGVGRVARKTARRIHHLRLDDGGRVPSLRQALRLSRNADVRILVDLKAMGSTTSFRRLANLVGTYGRRVTVMSRHATYLDVFRAFAPLAADALVTKRAPTAAELVRYDGVAVHHAAITRDWLDTMDTAGVQVFAWTVNTVGVWRRLSGAVDGIITDDTPGYADHRRTDPACHAR